MLPETKNGASGAPHTAGAATDTPPPSETSGAADATGSGPSRGLRQRWEAGDLVAVAEYFPPAGRRRLGVLIVRRCPNCAHLHQHRGGGATGDLRTGSCGKAYRLHVRAAVPAQEGRT